MANCEFSHTFHQSVTDLIDTEDDLISFASADSPPAANQAVEQIPSLPLTKAADRMGEFKRNQLPHDSFADLTGLMRARKPWAPVQSVPPSTNGMIPLSLKYLSLTSVSASRNRSNGSSLAPQAKPFVLQRAPPIESYLRESGFSTPTPVQQYHTPEPEIGPYQSTGSATLVNSEHNDPVIERLEALRAEIAELDSCDNEDTAQAANLAEIDDAQLANNRMLMEDSHLMTNSFVIGSEFEDTPPMVQSPSPVSQPSLPPQALIDVDELQSTADVDTTTLASPTFRFNDPVEDEPVVRLTQAAWNSVTEQVATLQKELSNALKQNAQLQREKNQVNSSDRDVSTKIGKLQYQLETNKNHKAAMGREIKQKDMELYKKEMEIDALKAQLKDADSIRKQLERVSAELGYLRTSKATDEEAQTRSIANITASKDKEIAELKAAASRNQSAGADHATRARNNAEALAKQQKIIQDYKEKLFNEQDTVNKLRDRLDDLQKSIPLRKELEDLQAKLREKSSLTDKQRNELKLMTRRLELLQQSLHKVKDGAAALRGAAHLINPKANAKLPKLVFPCMECFIRNIDCDSNSQCENCALRGDKCSRWRCSMRQVMQECKEVPCRFTHDINGWLTTTKPRPQW